MEPIKLVKAECLPIMRAAFERGELQAQKPYGPGDPPFMACKYTGPCVIGVCVPVERRADLDRPRLPAKNNTDFRSLFEIGVFDADDPDWFTRAQVLHDSAAKNLPDRAERMKDLRRFLFADEPAAIAAAEGA